MQKKIKISILFSIFSISVFSMNMPKLINEKNQNTEKCSSENIELKTERIEKKRKFIFWRLPHKKIIITDRIINSNGKTIVKKISIHICSSDACDAIKFQRIKIIGKEIWIFTYNKAYEKAIIKRYNSCGKYLAQESWDKDKSFEDY